MTPSQAAINLKHGLNGNVDTPEESAGPLIFAFTGAAPVIVDLTSGQQQGLLSYAKSMYVDNGNNANIVVVTFANGFTIVAKGNTQGWYPVLTPKSIILSASWAAGAGTTNIWLASYAVAPAVWPTV